MHHQLQDGILHVIMEEIDDNEEIYGNVDTNIGSKPLVLKSSMSTSGTGTSRTNHARGLHQVQDINSESDSELDPSDEINDARMQDPKNEVIVTRDS